VQGVAGKADVLCVELGLTDRRLAAAAWLHDVGYAPELVDTGFHALDGARFLLRLGVDPVVASLVAHHSYAGVEASVRGLAKELDSDFDKPPALMADALCYCDMTTGPDGVYVSVDDRLYEIRKRYGHDAVVTQFIHQAAAQIVAAVERVETLRASLRGHRANVRPSSRCEDVHDAAPPRSS
jgi:hypothetical protein